MVRRFGKLNLMDLFTNNHLTPDPRSLQYVRIVGNIFKIKCKATSFKYN